MRFARTVLLACLCVLFASVAFADSIPVSDSTFGILPNSPLNNSCAGTGCAYQYVFGTLGGWTFSNAGVFQPGANTVYFNSLPDGSTTAFINQGGSISQALGASVQPNTTYTLDVQIGDRIGAGLNGTAYLVIGGQMYQATDLTPPGSGDWGTYAVTFACDNSCSQVGDSIEILLESTGFQGNFAGVQMSDSVPEPGALSMLLLGLLALGVFGWRRRSAEVAVS